MKVAGTLILFLLAHSASAWTLLGNGPIGWPDPKITLYLNPTGCAVAENLLDSMLDEAIRVWNSSPTSSLQLTRAAEHSAVTADEYLAGDRSHVPLIVCDFTFSANHGGVSADGVPALTEVDFTNNRLSEAAIFMNAQAGADANIVNLENGQLQLVITHELGHAFGLGHSSITESLMYYSVADKAEAYLTEDDMDGLSYLYPVNDFRSGTFGCASSKRPQSSTSFALFWCLILGAVWSLRFLGRTRFISERLP